MAALDQVPGVVSTDQSWDDQALVYSDKTTLALDFAYCISLGVAANAANSGIIVARGVSAPRIQHPIPLVQSGRLRELFRNGDGTHRLQVYKQELCCSSVAFDELATSAWKAKAKAESDASGIVAIEANGGLVIRSTALGTSLVLAGIPASIDITRRFRGSFEGGVTMSLDDIGVAVHLVEPESGDGTSFSIDISVLGGGPAKSDRGQFGFTYVTLTAADGAATYMQVTKKALGSYVFSVWEYSAVWR